MTRVDFYVLESTDREGFVCRLTEKAWRLGHQVLLLVADDGAARQLDELLWTFNDQAFVPHERCGTHLPAAPVLIAPNRDPGNTDDLLINLTDAVPSFFSRFHRVAEIVDTDENHRQTARQRYRFYQQRGYPLHRHAITA